MNRIGTVRKYLDGVNSMADFRNNVRGLKTTEIGYLFELLGCFYLRSRPEYVTRMTYLELYDDINPATKFQLKLPDKDEGIDALAMINGEYVAIQFKYRSDPSVMIPWENLATFFGLSFGLSDQIQKGFFITNTDKLHPNVENSDKVFTITGSDFRLLGKEFFDGLRKWLDGETVDKQSMPHIDSPRPYQSECCDKCYSHFSENKRGFIEMACGTGKTYQAFIIDKVLDNDSTIIFVPSLYLLSQFYHEWLNQYYYENKKNQVCYLLIGSDADLRDDYYKKLTMHTELTTNIDQIKKFLVTPIIKKVIICTYQSSDKLSEAATNYRFDFAIYDECHKTVGNLNKYYSKCLDKKYIMIKNRLFMTATPKIYTGKFCQQSVSMNNTEIYGQKIFSYNFAQAIKNGYLTDYQIISWNIINSEIQGFINDKKLVELTGKKYPAKYVACAIQILKNFQQKTCNHMVTYHQTIEKSNKFKNLLLVMNEILFGQNKLDIYIEYLSGNHTMRSRTQIIGQFIDSPMAIICSAKVLNEGINIPIIDSVTFVDQRKSTVDIVQCVGRSLRLYAGKQLAHIFVPAEITDLENLIVDNYEPLIQILKAMKSVDERIVEYFKFKSTKVTTVRELVVHECINEMELINQIDLAKWSDKITNIVWHKVSDKWASITDIQNFVKENDRIPRTNCTDVTEKALGKTCAKFRSDYRNGNLSQDKIDALKKIKSWWWTKDKHQTEAVWIACIEQTIANMEKNGDPTFTRSQITKDILPRIIELIGSENIEARLPQNNISHILTEKLCHKKNKIEKVAKKTYKIINFEEVLKEYQEKMSPQNKSN